MIDVFWSPTVSIRTNFAIHHLRAAVQAARNAHSVEQSNLTAGHGAWFDEMIVLVPVSVIMAAAALEANVNEIIQDILDGSSGLPVTEGRKRLITDLKTDQTGNATEKYRRLSLLYEKIPDSGAVAWQDAKLLIGFRNKFMHFRPAWDYEKEVHEGNLVQGLKTRIPIYRAYQSNFQFPYGFMTYGCAKWSVQSVLNFSGAFATLLGIRDRFDDKHLNFSTP
jgi:hypothetical protein